MNRPPAKCSCGSDPEETAAPSAAENAFRLRISVLPTYELKSALAEYERQHEPCCAVDAASRLLRSA
jgi:hypothetical protein